MERNCGNCRFWNVKHSDGGRCACIAPLPQSLKGFFVRSKYMLSTSGTNCEAWHKRIVRQPKVKSEVTQ
jgi:hypothetical protein